MEALFLGTVISFKKQKGFGHIEPDDKKKFGDKVFCHWKTIQTSEKWPTLVDGMRVAFQAERDPRNKDLWKTTEVYDEDGDEVTTEGGKKAANSNGQKAQKGRIRKRPISKVTKDKKSVPIKKNKSSASYFTFAGNKIKRSQLSSGSYGGMDLNDDDVIEVGLLIRNHWAGSLIGKKGVVINKIRKLSKANMKFGDDDVDVNGAMYNVFAVNGTMNQVSDACKMVANALGESAQSLEYKIVFLVPDQYCGTFVGKKGSTINEIRGEQDKGVRVVLGQDPIMLPGSVKITLCSLFGPRENMQDGIERTVAVLGAIAARVNRPMDMEWGGGWYAGQKGNRMEGRSGRRW